MRSRKPPIQNPLRIPILSVFLSAFLLSCWPSPVLPEVIEDWSGVVPWFTFTFRKANRTGRFMDSNGSRINFGKGRTPKGKRAIKLTYNLLRGGYSGAWNCLDRTVDIRQFDYLSFEVKASVPGRVRMAIKDDRNVTYVTSFLAPSSDWVEVNLPITVFVKDRFATPASLQNKFMTNAEYEEAVIQNMDPYEQAVREAAMNREKKGGKSKKMPDEKLYEGIQELDTRTLAAEEVLCGPGQQQWGPETPIDWGRIKTFCLSPLITGNGEVQVGPIEALKWKKKAAPTPTMQPTPTQAPPLNQALSLDVLELPTSFYVRFTGPGIYQLELLDAAGRHYQTLFHQRISSQKEAWVQWNGVNEQGTAAPPGLYLLELTKDGMPLRKIPLFLKAKKP